MCLGLKVWLSWSPAPPFGSAVTPPILGIWLLGVFLELKKQTYRVPFVWISLRVCIKWSDDSVFLGKPFTLGSDKSPFGPIQSLQSFCLDICAARNVKYTKPKWTVINRIHKINKTCLGCNLHSWAVEFYSAIVLSSFLKRILKLLATTMNFFFTCQKKLCLLKPSHT